MSSTIVNGQSAVLPDDPDALLVDVLRHQLMLTGTKLVCGSGVCGACTVLLDGVPVASCLLPARAAAGRSITTIEGIGAPKLHAVQKAFMAHDALQCGFCTPGFVVEAAAFCDRWRSEKGTQEPTRSEIAAALSGHLCRCGAYDNIYRAVAEACLGRHDADVATAPRIEAREKVTGAAKYTVDLHVDGQLVGVVLRSPLPHAMVAKLDLAPALAVPGVKAAVSLLGTSREVNFAGQQIAAVAAETAKAAYAGIAAIGLKLEPLPAAIGLDAARSAGAPLSFSDGKSSGGNASEGAVVPLKRRGNVRGPAGVFSHNKKAGRRWIAEARRARDPLLVEATFRTGIQQHTALEPHTALARFEGDRLIVHASTQSVYEVRKQIAARFKLDPAKVQVLAEHIGGGFGSKGRMTDDVVVAVELARAAKAPVRILYTRHEELSVAGYRPAADMAISLLPGRDGSLKALSIEAYADSGVAINSTIAGLARLIYPAKAKELADYDVISNLPPGAPFRGPGGPPMNFALEQAIDEAALRLKSDPIALRKKWDPNPVRQRLYDWAAGLETWRRRDAGVSDGRFRRGVGVASGFWPYIWQSGTKIELSIENGKVVVATAVQDIGTGTRSVLADRVAAAFDLDPGEVVVRIGDSSLPEGPGSGGSRVTASVVPPLLLAIDKLKAELQRRAKRPASAGANTPWRELIAAAGKVKVHAERPEDARKTIYGNTSLLKDAGILGTVFAFMMRRSTGLAIGAGAPSSVQVVEVEVDTWLGHTRVIKAHTGIGVGKVAAPALARNQAAGAVVQGIGYALYEDRELDPKSGQVLSANLEDYRIPGIADIPPIDVHFDEGGFDHVLGGSVGIGEVATVPTASAIANAIRAAIGVRPLVAPVTPDRLLALLKKDVAA